MSINKILASHKAEWRIFEEWDPSKVINYKTPNFYCLRTKCAEETKGLGWIIWKIQYIFEGIRGTNELCEQDKVVTHLWNRIFYDWKLAKDWTD